MSGLCLCGGDGKTHDIACPRHQAWIEPVIPLPPPTPFERYIDATRRLHAAEVAHVALKAEWQEALAALNRYILGE